MCVLGMHRAGTSVVASLLELLGAHLGPVAHLMEPDETNPAGFWEHQGLTDLNDELLDAYGGSWHEPPALGGGWEDEAAATPIRAKARLLIEADFAEKIFCAWKDPRTCLTLPFWRSLGLCHDVVVVDEEPPMSSSAVERELSITKPEVSGLPGRETVPHP